MAFGLFGVEVSRRSLAGSLAFFAFLLGGAALLDSVGSMPGGYDHQRFVLVAVLILLAPFSCFCTGRETFFKVLGWVLFVSGIFFSTALVDSTPYRFSESILYPSYLLAVSGLALLIGRGSENGPVAVVSGLMLCAVIYALLTPSVYLFAVFDGVVRLDRYLPWGFANIRYWSHTATWLIPLFPLAMSVGPLARFRLWRIIVVLAAGIWWWLVFLSAARGTFFSLLIALLLMLYVFRGSAWNFCRLLGWQFLSGVCIWLLLSVILPSLLVADVEMRPVGTDSSGRVTLWWEALAMSIESFPLGQGSQSWLTHEPLTEAYAERKKLGSPHNMYLLWASEYGWLSVLGLGLIAVHFILRVFHFRGRVFAGKFREPEITLACGVLMSVMAALVHSGVSAVFIAPASMLVGLVILAVFASVFDGMGSVGVSFFKHKLRVVAALSLCVILVAWGYRVWGYYLDMQKDSNSASETYSVGIKPRFWLHGFYPRRPELMLDQGIDQGKWGEKH